MSVRSMRILAGLVVLAWLAAPRWAAAVWPTPGELAEARRWAAAKLEGAADEKPDDASRAYGTEPFFSFTYGGKPSAEVLKSWAVKRASQPLDAQSTEHTITYADPATGMTLRCVGIEYRDFPAVQWTLSFKNTGASVAPVLAGVKPLDIEVERKAGRRDTQTEFVLHHRAAGAATASDDRPLQTPLGPAAEKQITSVGMKADVPCFNVQFPGRAGVIVVVDWDGPWTVRFARDKGHSLRTQAGGEPQEFKLAPGEEIRLPRIVLLFWRGECIRSENLWRRWMLAHNVPRAGIRPLPAQLAGIRPEMGDYYRLALSGPGSAGWTAWQFDRPESDEGIVEAVREAACETDSICPRLHGLDPLATYVITNRHAPGNVEMTGGELLDRGLPIAVQTRPGNATIVYRKKPGSTGGPPTSRPVDHSKLMLYWTPDGQPRPVRTAADWAIRRGQILKGMESAFGPLPDRSKLPPPEVKVIDRDEGVGFVRLNIAYRTVDDDWVPAHLYLPKDRPAGKRVPAMLALHPTSTLGKRRVAGEASDFASLNRAYGKELAQRGYVVLAPDYPSFGDYRWDLRRSRYASGSMQAVFDNMRGVDLLQAREEVDPERIGAIGHSLGGHNAIFTGVFDQRIKVVVSSCGWTPFSYYYNGAIGGWTSDRYMPRLRDVYGLDPQRVPFDFYEVVAALAPRAFFSNSPLADSNFAVDGVRDAEPKAREVFALLGASDQFQVRHPDSVHDFTPEVRREAYVFIDRVLQHTPSRDLPAEMPPGIGSLMRVVDLKVGQEASVELADGKTAAVKLVALDESRDKVRDAVRQARVTVLVNGKQAVLTSATYHLPVVVDCVQIDCAVTAGCRTNGGQPEIWGLEADARLRLWPAGSPLMPAGSMVYPVDQRWFATQTQMANEVAYLLYGESPTRKQIYYHYGQDIGGADQRVPVFAATSGLIVTAGDKVLEGQDIPAEVKPRYDWVYIRDCQGWYHRYAHLDSIDPGIKVGQQARMGQRIGTLGKEGNSGGWAHLHWDAMALQPSGSYGIVECYAFLWEAYRQQWLPKLQAVARPHQLTWAGDPVTLDATLSWSSRGASHIARYEWSLSDGTTATGSAVTHRYDRPGTYEEVLKITDADGNTDYDFAQVQVADREHPDQQPPGLHAAYWPTRSVKAGDPVTFLVRSFRPAGDDGEEIWDFGDGTPAVKVRSDGNADKRNKKGYAATTHRYAGPGRYLVTVRRTNVRGETGTAHLQVFVDSR